MDVKAKLTDACVTEVAELIVCNVMQDSEELQRAIWEKVEEHIEAEVEKSDAELVFASDGIYVLFRFGEQGSGDVRVPLGGPWEFSTKHFVEDDGEDFGDLADLARQVDAFVSRLVDLRSKLRDAIAAKEKSGDEA